MMLSLTVNEIEKLRDLLQENIRKTRDGLKTVDAELRESLIEPIEEREKLLSYLESKIPKDY